MKNNKGFTLIELMVIVAIIGILLAIAVPQIQEELKSIQPSPAQTNSGTIIHNN